MLPQYPLSTEAFRLVSGPKIPHSSRAGHKGDLCHTVIVTMLSATNHLAAESA